MSIHPVKLKPKDQTLGADYDQIANYYRDSVKNRHYQDAKNWLVRLAQEDRTLANLGEP